MSDEEGCAKGVPMYELRLSLDRCEGEFRPRLATPNEVAEFVLKLQGCAAREHFHALYTDPNNRLLGVQEVAIGGMTSAPVDPRVVLAPAIIVGASAIVLTHNHPSGEPEPSNDDVQVTKLIAKAALIVGIRLLDHIVTAQPDKFVSLLSRGMYVPPRSAFDDFAFAGVEQVITTNRYGEPMAYYVVKDKSGKVLDEFRNYDDAYRYWLARGTP